MQNEIKNAFDAIKIPFTQRQVEQLEKYADLLLSWNEKMNLTAITQPKEIAVKHFADCAACLLHAPLSGSLIDVGTGAGFPGMVLKILQPSLHVTLLDSLNKRLLFLQEVIKTLELSDISVVHARAEDGGHNKTLREHFDIATARAVANLQTLSEYCLPFVKIGGLFLAMKGPDVTNEIQVSEKAIDKLGGKVQTVGTTMLPDSDIVHSYVLIKKVRQTPTAYPRKAGKPAKEPLK